MLLTGLPPPELAQFALVYSSGLLAQGWQSCKCLIGLPTARSEGGIFSVKLPSSQMILDCVRLTRHASVSSVTLCSWLIHTNAMNFICWSYIWKPSELSECPRILKTRLWDLGFGGHVICRWQSRFSLSAVFTFLSFSWCVAVAGPPTSMLICSQPDTISLSHTHSFFHSKCNLDTGAW